MSVSRLGIELLVGKGFAFGELELLVVLRIFIVVEVEGCSSNSKSVAVMSAGIILAEEGERKGRRRSGLGVHIFEWEVVSVERK